MHDSVKKVANVGSCSVGLGGDFSRGVFGRLGLKGISVNAG